MSIFASVFGPSNANNFFTKESKFFIQLNTATLKKGKDLYDHQLGHLANALIVEDYDAAVEVDTATLNVESSYVFPVGSLVSGSFVMNYVSTHVGKVPHQYDDIDIYFKSIDDAKDFVRNNSMYGFQFTNPMCAYGQHNGNKFNLIYGVEYTSPENLISRFDIRACSMAIDINNKMLYVVRGSVEDATQKQITFNPVPRGATIRRLTKYIKKGFEIEKHQSVFFVELLRSNIYSQELELMTKEY